MWPRSATGPVTVLIGTRKGAFCLRGDWRTVLTASHTGHLGPTAFRSTDAGKIW